MRSVSHHLGDRAVVAVVAVLVLGVWLGWPALPLGLLLGLMARARALVAALLVTASLLGWWSGVRAWQQAQPRQLGSYTGWAEIIGDPAPYGNGLRVTVEIEGERFDAWVYGGARRKLAAHQGGEFVWLDGRRTALSASQRRALVRHVVGRFQVESSGDVVDGSPFARASNRVRLALRGTAEGTMEADEAALFTGLVIGDDARQPEWMIEEFRASGMSHLTAVSGQNVGFVLAAALPLLRRLRPWWRWAATIGLIGWFMALTRFEPSVLRAGVMAMLSATAYVRGQQVRPVRVLALACGLLVLLDPLLVWSVGFWLSVGATAGVCVVGPWLEPRLPAPKWLRLPMAVTLGAQVGVALPSILVFGRLPVVSLPANLAAVPVAGFVMLYGLPAGLLASFLPEWLQAVVMMPAELGTRWVATVARVAAAVEPSPRWSAAWWLVGLACLALWWKRSRPRRCDVPI